MERPVNAPLIYHGWADQQVAPGASIKFYNSVLKLSAQPTRASQIARNNGSVASMTPRTSPAAPSRCHTNRRKQMPLQDDEGVVSD